MNKGEKESVRVEQVIIQEKGRDVTNRWETNVDAHFKMFIYCLLILVLINILSAENNDVKLKVVEKKSS